MERYGPQRFYNNCPTYVRRDLPPQYKLPYREEDRRIHDLRKTKHAFFEFKREIEIRRRVRTAQEEWEREWNAVPGNNMVELDPAYLNHVAHMLGLGGVV
ncbi:MAG: hypothetical protein LBP65_02590 [Puniceicoccales bacterium]|jgi:hypothetical protein|nr:hypothetical protein [Puniceicoccales bacterium]